MFAIDLSRKAHKETLRGFDNKETGYVLPLKKKGLYDSTTDTYGWRFPDGATGICYLGDSMYYISRNSSKPEQSSTLTLYRWTGVPEGPFEKVKF